jgi:cell fate regulator YaaT (PSP1 superfamily)
MPTVVGVRLRFSKTLWFDPAGAEPVEGETVIVETERGTELGTVVQTPHEVAEEQLPAALKPVVRVAGEEDLAHAEELAAKEREAMPVFRQLVADYKLDMKPVDVEYLFDGDKIVFYFSAEERVDFRDLVRDLASRFRARIDMRQVGVRDEARMVGGVGHCGQMLCCVRFGGEFQPVSIRMAKEQDLPLNPLKISGLCGRLMCCLRYEFDAYKDYKSRAPKRGAIVETPVGGAKVTDLNTPRETVTMRLEDGTNVTVPLASMDCSKGGGCPCSVGREALETAMGPSPIATAFAEPAVERKLEESRPERARGTASEPGAQEGTGRRRRRRKPAQEAGSAGQKQGGPKPAEKKQADKKPAEQKPAEQKAGETATAAAQEGERPKSGRRRRRRKPGGGGNNAS